MFRHHHFLLLLGILSCWIQFTVAQQDYSCSAQRPCKLGCCGKNNVCGMGPKYCGPGNCLSGCDAKSECNPGWGSQWSNRDKCPLNVCCSEFGFCGTTKEFCGDKKVKKPSCPGGTSANKRVIGYYEGWSTSKACNGLNPENMLYTAYSHLNYAFAFINPKTYEIANMQDSDTEYMPRLTALKNYNPDLQVFIAIGGWSMNDPDQPTKRTFSELAASTTAQKAFFSSLLSFMDKYGFDGVDIDWEYPVAEERSGKPEDFKNYVSFLKNLRGVLGSKGLTLTLPASYWYLQHFDLKNMEQYLDWFNVMSYDLHGTWDGTNPYLGPYINSHTNLTEIDLALELLWRNNIDPKRVVMGMGFYGRSFTLADPACKTAGCKFTSGGNPGRCSASAGTLMFNEIQEIINAGGAQITTDKKAAVKIVTWGNNQWVSYDDEETLKAKMDYANSLCLGGVMVWAASTDDNKGTAIRALAKAGGRDDFSVALNARAVNTDASKCVWGECGASCSSGLVPVESSGSNASPLGIESGCNKGKRNLCCPAKNPPSCKWKGSPKFCGMLAKNRCSGKEIEVAASTDGCWTGHKSLCCSKTDSTSNLDSCEWLGAAPFCSTAAGIGTVIGLGTTPLTGAFSFTSYGCPKKEKPKELTKSKQGEGGQQSCSYNGGFKSYCCSDPAPWKGCKWRAGGTTWVQWEKILAGPLVNLFVDFSTDCKTGCEDGEVTVATDGFGCRSGTYSYFCCDDPNTPTNPAPPEISLCPGPAYVSGLSRTPETGTNAKNIFEEGNVFHAKCPSLPGGKRRRVPHYPRVQGSTNSAVGLNHTRTIEPHAAHLGYLSQRALFGRDLNIQVEKRGLRGPAMALCNPKGNGRASLYTQNHPGAPSILKLTGKAWTVARRGVCAAVGVTGLLTLDPNADWVTEHVFEKQELRDNIEYMLKGTLPDGTPLKAGAVAFQGVFDDNGLFQNNWASPPSLAVARNWVGNIQDTFFGILGRTSDAGLNNQYTANLQVCDADFNRYKEYIVAGSEWMSNAEWTQYDAMDRIGILTDVIDSFGYRSKDIVVTSYSSSNTGLTTLWGDFAKHAAANGVNYDFVGAWKEIVAANLKYQVKTATTLFLKYLNGEIAYWASAAAKKAYAPAIVAAEASKLADFKKNVATLLEMPISKMTA